MALKIDCKDDQPEIVKGRKMYTHIVIKRLSQRQRLRLPHHRFARILPRRIRHGLILLVQLRLPLRELLHHLPIQGRLELEDLQQLLILALGIGLQSP